MACENRGKKCDICIMYSQYIPLVSNEVKKARRFLKGN